MTSADLDSTIAPTDEATRATRSNTPPRLAVVVPYRDRGAHLDAFLSHVPAALSGIPHTLFVVEQANDLYFNRGLLLNIGMHVARKRDEFAYFCCHDVDLMPIKVDYGFAADPTHLAARLARNAFREMYAGYFGGVCLLTPDHLAATNGFSNRYWGWGAEDDDLYWRIKTAGLAPQRRQGRFEELPHELQRHSHPHYPHNFRRLQAVWRGKVDTRSDGLAQLDFTVVDRGCESGYCHLRVDFPKTY